MVPATKIWQSWMGGEYVVATNATATTGDVNYVWNTWTTSATTSTGTIAYDYNYTWQRWERAAADVEEIRRLAQQELDAVQARREERAARQLADRVRLTGAEERAVALFRSLLTPEQLADFDNPDIHSVTVRGSEGGLYEIETDGRLHGNIKAVDEHGCVLGRLCVAPSMYDGNFTMPTSDGYVGQLLGIKFNEELLVTTGNWSHRRECQQPHVPILRTPLAA